MLYTESSDGKFRLFVPLALAAENCGMRCAWIAAWLLGVRGGLARVGI